MEGKFKWVFGTLLLIGIAANAGVKEDPKSLALRLFQRIAGVKVATTDPRIAQMIDLIRAGKYLDAADIPTRDASFLNVTVYQFFAPKSLRTESTDSGFNDMVAMGMLNTRDDQPYTEMVAGDFTVRVNGVTAGLTGTAPNQRPALTNNTHFQTAEQNRPNLGADLVRVAPQRLNFNDAAGALTSRQFLAEHANMGTNRRIIEYAFRAFLCTPITNWRDSDPTLSDELVTRDVSRAPGGDPMAYQNECRKCHQLMDPLRAAFAFHDFNGTSPAYTAGAVAAKINRDVQYADGNTLAGDAFENRALLNHNSQFGWQGTLSGNGAKSFGQMLARSDRFSSCAVEQVFGQVCRRSPSTKEKSSDILSIAREFKSDNYNLRGVFKRVATLPQCMGELE